MLLTGPRYDAHRYSRTCDDPPMHRTVTAHLQLDVAEPALLALQIAVPARLRTGAAHGVRDGEPVPVREIDGAHGGGVHIIDAPVGTLVIDYAARPSACGRCRTPAGDEPTSWTYLRPSRYCPSDRLLAIAERRVRRDVRHRRDRLAVTGWVRLAAGLHRRVQRPHRRRRRHAAAGAGVCRDFAHLTIALCRRSDIPARLVAVYAPGLSPMDFHAVAEARVDGAWEWSTPPAWPRASRSSASPPGATPPTPRSPTTHCGAVTLTGIEVTATADPFPNDPDPTAAVVLR